MSLIKMGTKQTPASIFFTHSAEETIEVGKQIAHLLQEGDIVFLFGDLGSGKTTLTKGLITELTNTSMQEITSPTFTYLNTYSGVKKVHHFDLYRLSSPHEFLDAGFHEFLSEEAICCIEWPDKLPQGIKETYRIEILYEEKNTRKITLYPGSSHAS